MWRIFWPPAAARSSKTENVVTEIDSVNGNIVETAESVGRAYLYINVIHKSVDEMAEQCGFSESQKEQLSELLSEDNKKMWSDVLYDNTAYNRNRVLIWNRQGNCLRGVDAFLA